MKKCLILFLAIFVISCEEEPLVPNDNERNEEVSQTKPATKSYGDVIHLGVVPENRETTFIIAPGNVHTVTFQPWKAGRWVCYAWHTNLLLADKNAATSYYWRDANNPNDSYHFFGNRATGYLFALRSEIIFFSGSAGITYEIRFNQFSNMNMPITVWVAPA
ncbi:MAG: hypothetical protein PHR57_00030 [Patescibacteria group bacterium]|nr:hypothetical protein [Patescibacteria group bacterium]